MMIKVIGKSVVLFGLCALGAPVYAASQWYFAVGAGLEMPNVRSSTTVNNNSLASPPYNQDIYSSTDKVNPAILLEVGKQWEIKNTGLNSLALGMQYQYYLPTDVGKQIMQYSSPEFLNYRYRLNLVANMLLLNAKIELFSWKNISPFINAGAGAVALTARNYHEYAYSGVTARTTPDFHDRTNYQFIYQVGGGINWRFKPAIIGSLNYFYQPLGRFVTNQGTGLWSNRRLNFNHVSAQAAFFTITYLV